MKVLQKIIGKSHRKTTGRKEKEALLNYRIVTLAKAQKG